MSYNYFRVNQFPSRTSLQWKTWNKDFSFGKNENSRKKKEIKKEIKKKKNLVQ